MKADKEIRDKVTRKMTIIKEMLGENGLLTEADDVNLELLEGEFIIYELCNKDIEKYGITIKDNKGSLKTNPSLNARNKSANTILNILKEYSISTKSRQLLLMKDIDTDKDDSPLTAYMKTIR